MTTLETLWVAFLTLSFVVIALYIMVLHTKLDNLERWQIWMNQRVDKMDIHMEQEERRKAGVATLVDYVRQGEGK